MKLSQSAMKLLFNEARTHNGFIDKQVPEMLLRQALDLAKMGPTSANCSPMRVVFVKSPEGKALLVPAMAPGNAAKTASAPVTAIIGYDLEFYEKLPQLFPSADARSWFAGNEQLIADTAFRNGTLQAAYLILALRAVGLDTGPMSGFDNAKIDAEFFAGTKVKSNFVCNIGYGDPSKLFPRSPRFEFDEFARFA